MATKYSDMQTPQGRNSKGQGEIIELTVNMRNVHTIHDTHGSVEL